MTDAHNEPAAICDTRLKHKKWRQTFGQCVLCNRKTDLTFHHLIPKKMHRRSYFKKHYNKQQLNEGISICRPCHSGIHKSYDEMTLAKYYCSLSLISNDETLAAHFAWVSKQRVHTHK